MRAAVEQLLASLDDDAFMRRPADRTAMPDASTEMARFKPEAVGDQIGNYTLRERIGEGGFGTVWVAEQEKPVRRRVALKIIKLGMDTKEVIARFEQERQALAMMDHPNIAKVLEAGATSLGRPYFVMELVRGVKITRYCDQSTLPTAARLKLFTAVCHAVQHAHQKGTTSRIEHWLVRKGTNHADGTVTWETFELAFPGTYPTVYGVLWQRGVACVGNDVYIVGAGGVYGNDWVVIKGRDGGANWANVDNYRLDSSGPSEAYAISADNAGNLFVAGTASKTVTSGKGRTATTTTTNYWIVRKAAPGGTGWQTVDAFVFPGGFASPTSVAVDRFNNVHVCGRISANSVPTQWITRKGSGGAWTTTDTFTYANNGGGTGANSICADPDGNVFAAGGSWDSTTTYRNWLVRRKLAP